MFQKLTAQARQILTPLLNICSSREPAHSSQATASSSSSNTMEQLELKTISNPAQDLHKEVLDSNNSTHTALNLNTSTHSSFVPTKTSDILRALLRANRFAFWIPGFALASWTPLIPFVQRNFNLGSEHLGLVLMCLATGQAIATVLSPMLISLLGCRRTVKVMGLTLVGSLLSITLLSNLYLLCLVLVLYGWIAETVSMAANLNAVHLEGQFKRPLLSGLNGILSLGSVAGVLLVTTMLHVNLPLPLPVLCGAELMSMLVLLYCSQVASNNLLGKEQMSMPFLGIAELAAISQQQGSKGETQATLTSESEATTVASHSSRVEDREGEREHLNVLKNPLLWGLGLMCLITYVTEDSVNDWSGIYLVQDYGVPLQEAGLGFLAFAVMMTLSRLLGDKLVLKFGRKSVIFGGAMITATGFMLATSSLSTTLSLLGFALVGLGTANIAPQCISYAASLKSLPPSSIFVVNGVGALGSLAGPALIGQLSALVTLHHTFLMLAVALTGVAALSIVIVKDSRHSSSTYTLHINNSLSIEHIAQGREGQQHPLQVAQGTRFSQRFLLRGYDYTTSPEPTEATSQGEHHESLKGLSYSLGEFVALENPNIFWQNFSLQNWTISLDEPPGG